MAYDFFTIQALAGQLAARLGGRRIEAARAATADLELDSGDATLVVRTGSRGALFVRARGPAGGGRGGQEPVLAYLIGARVAGVTAHAVDRVIELRLERVNSQGRSSWGWLRVELVRPHVTAILGRARNEEVIAVWGRRGQSQPCLRPGAAYAALTGPARLLPGRDTVDAFLAALLRDGDRPVAPVAAAVLAMADRRCLAAILAEMGQPAEVTVTQLGDAGIRELWQRCQVMYREPPSTPCALWRQGDGWDFSVLPPVPLPPAASLHVSVSAATVGWLDAQACQAGPGCQQERARTRLAARERRLVRRLEALADDLAEAAAAEELERKGSTLLASLAQVAPGAARVVLADIHDPGGTARIEIELEPERTAADNAARYLKRASKLYRRRQVVPARLDDCRARLEEVRRLAQDLERRGAGDLERVEAWLATQHSEGSVRAGPVPAARASAHPRRYRTSTGWSVWAGRSNRENDVLTHRLAAQNDFWFHAHGYAGAHVILRREGRVEEPSAATLEEAAAVAAYWSKGKTARRVPVIYALVRHVSRPRGAPAGQAAVRREKTLMVRPRLLAAEDSVL